MNDKPLFTHKTLKKALAYHCWITLGWLACLIANSIMTFAFQKLELRDESGWRLFHGIFRIACFLFYVGFAVFCVKRASLRCPFCNARLSAGGLLSSGGQCPKCKNTVCENDALNDAPKEAPKEAPEDAPAASPLPLARAELVREFAAWKRRSLLTSVVSTMFLALFIAAFCRGGHSRHPFAVHNAAPVWQNILSALQKARRQILDRSHCQRRLPLLRNARPRRRIAARGRVKTVPQRRQAEARYLA